jgi:hypothetical protein
MFNQRMEDMEKHMDTSTKLLPLLKKKFKEGQDSLMQSEQIGTSIEHNLYTLCKKVIQMDNWKEDRFTQMMA